MATPVDGEDGSEWESEDRVDRPMLDHITYRNAAPIKLYSTMNGYK